MVANIFMLASELFTEFYSGGGHTASARYLFLGLEGHAKLVPWIWTAEAFNALSGVILFLPKTQKSRSVLVVACELAFIGVWIEKGMGLVVPGFIPSALHEIVEYLPSLVEWKVTAGIWAFGILLYSAAIKVALPVLTGRMQLGRGGKG